MLRCLLVAILCLSGSAAQPYWQSRAQVSINACPASSTWVPAATGVNADLFMDFTTEGAACPHYWYNATTYSSFANWLSALGGTFTRAATTGGAWYTNSSGLLASAGTNVLRFNYNPTGPVNVGILLEPAATNLAFWSRDLTQSGTWVATTMTTALTSTGADGTSNSATRLTATAILATILQTPGLGSAARTYSVYVRCVVCTGTIKLTVDGTTFSSDFAGSLNSSTYTRISAVQTTVPIIGIQIGTSGDAIDVDFNQLEAGGTTAAPTSPILTTTATVTRAVDILNWPIPFTAWSTTTGSVVATANGPNTAPLNRVFGFSDGTTSNRMAMGLVPSTGANTLIVTDTAVAQATLTVVGANTAAYQNNKIGIAYAANNFAAVVNGGTVATDNSGSIPAAINIANLATIGTSTGAGNSINISQFGYWAPRISDGDLQTLTTP